MEALQNDAASGASTSHKGNSNDLNNNQIEKCTYNSTENKKCSSCGLEKATIVCSGCTGQAKSDNTDFLPALKISENLLDEYYELRGAPSAQKLVADGHMVYCDDCFHITHCNLDTLKHARVEMYEDVGFVVEDKLVDLIEQIELDSELHADRLLENEVSDFRRRTSHLNDVKQSIREMNDVIRDDLYLDFGALAALMENKLNEISDRIKEKLKDAYSVVRDLQNKLNEKIDALERNLHELDQLRQQPNSCEHVKAKKSEILSRIDQLNDELRSICEPNLNFNSCHPNSTFSCSLFVDNNLYPQFNYQVDLSKVIECINSVCVQISTGGGESRPWSDYCDKMCLSAGFEFDAVINSGIQSNGLFWTQFIAPSEPNPTATNPMAVFKKNRIKSNQLLEEISRYVRSKTISDKHWLSYEQMGLSPKQGDKCFCLDTKTRKWLRAVVLSVDYLLRKCQVFYADYAFSDINEAVSFENILPWRDFELANVPDRAVKCLLYNNAADSKTQYEQDIHQEAKFLFKDLTAGKAIKCVLVEPTLVDNMEQAWICKVYQINEEKNLQFVSVNKKIIEMNRKENAAPRDSAFVVKFASRDIRLNSVRSSKPSPLSSSSSFTPNNVTSTIVAECRNKFNKVSERAEVADEFSSDSHNVTDEPFDTNLDYSSAPNDQQEHEDNLDVEEQIAERRFYKNNSGMCHVTTSISNEGVLWIKPIVKHNLHEEFEKLSPLIEEFITRTSYRSYGDLKIEPQMHKKCFVRASVRRNVAGFYRGFIEKIFSQREMCRVRLMDYGCSREVCFADIYPHRRLDFNSIASLNDTDGFNDTDNHGLKLNYLSIRCCLFQTNFNNLNSKRDYFNRLISNKRVHFNLIELVTIGKLKCWYTELSVHNDLINMMIFNSLPLNDTIKKSKSEAIVKQLTKDTSTDLMESKTSSSMTTSNTNREWQPVETHPVISKMRRSSSMYDLKENSSLVDDSLDESRSIKVKSDVQSAPIDSEICNSDVLDEQIDSNNNLRLNSQLKSNKNVKFVQQLKKNKNVKLDEQFKSLNVKCEKTNVETKYESCPLFLNEPEWIVDSDQIVHQPSFVKSSGDQDEKKRDNKKRARQQCRPYVDSGSGHWNNGRDYDGNDGSSSKFADSANKPRRSRNNRQKKTTNKSTNKSGKNRAAHQSPDEDNSSAFNDVFLNNDDNSSLDQEEFFVENKNPLNSSPLQSPYQKLFKLNSQLNSYEQVLSRISENESLKNMRFEEAEKMRSLNLTMNGEHGLNNKIESNDTSLDSMPRLIIDQTDDEATGNEPVLVTLDQTHQIPNRHIINDIETNRSIRGDHRVAHNCKNRSYSAADVALVERNRLNLRPVLISSTSSSSTSSLTDLKKKVTDVDSDDSFESCAEEVKNYELRNSKEMKKRIDVESKLEKMKNFTVSIFVDDFEADLSKNSNESSLSMNEVEQARLNPNFFTIKSCHGNEKKSLEEFEKTEHSYKLDQEVFMFTGHPIRPSVVQNRASLAGRPPVPLNTHLSTIVELSNECSNNTDYEVKRTGSLDDTSKHWFNELDNNSSDFQKKIDFFNKDSSDIDFKHVTNRKFRRNSRDYDTLNESRRTKSVSSLSDNGHVMNSLSNNCLISESFQLSGARLNVTLEASFSSKCRHNANNSVLITDQLFEKFCLMENDKIMSCDNECQNECENDFKNRFKIKSKLLNDLLNEPVNEPASTLLQRSSSSPDISSYASDSLFNSHLIITPICSELVSPNQPGSIISRSMSQQQSTPHKNSYSLKSPISHSSLPPTPPPQSQTKDIDNNVTFSPLAHKNKNDEENISKNFPAQFKSNEHELGQQNNYSSRDLIVNFNSPISEHRNKQSTIIETSRDLNLKQSIIETSRDLNFESTMNEQRNKQSVIKTSRDQNLNSPISEQRIRQSSITELPRDSKFRLHNKDDINESAMTGLPPAPHFPLVKPNRNEPTKPFGSNNSAVFSNSCPNLTEKDRGTNKHFVNYLNSVKKSTGVDLEPIKRRSNSSSRVANFKSANFSLYGLDNEDEHEAKRKSLSEGDSIDAKSSMQKISLDTSEPAETDSFKFPPPPDQFINSSIDTLPPPPDQKELEAIASGEQPQPTSSSSQTTVIPVQTESPRLKTFMNSLKNLQTNNSADNSFKIDHLLDINPKRLYKNSKFKCRINDVIGDNGTFWIEVIYNEDDERKFYEMFKLFNLHVRLGEAPASFAKNQHVAAMYKNSWHRAVVLDECAPDAARLRVRFLDIGIEKNLDKQTDLRQADEKFFNFPNKALYCSLHIDQHVDQLPINGQIKVNKRLHVSKAAKKHFVKMVYKKVLYVKIIDFDQEHEPQTNSFKPVCKIKLGCQAHHGIIDVYMYLMSKYDREKYEFLKMLKKYIQNRPVLMSFEQESVQTTAITTTTEKNTLSTNTTILSPPDSLNATLKKMQDVYSDDECAQIENHQDDEIVDQEEDYDESDEDDVLFTDTVNYYYSKNVRNKDVSLDLTPVKDQHSKTSSLKITPVNLDHLDNSHENNLFAPNDLSTAKVCNKMRAAASNSTNTPVALPPSAGLSQKYVKMIRRSGQSQDADTSLTVNCCNLAGLKKWAKSSSKNAASLPKSFETYAQSGGFKDNVFDLSLNKSLNAKKVKFQVK